MNPVAFSPPDHNSPLMTHFKRRTLLAEKKKSPLGCSSKKNAIRAHRFQCHFEMTHFQALARKKQKNPIIGDCIHSTQRCSSFGWIVAKCRLSDYLFFAAFLSLSSIVVRREDTRHADLIPTRIGKCRDVESRFPISRLKNLQCVEGSTTLWEESKKKLIQHVYTHYAISKLLALKRQAPNYSAQLLLRWLSLLLFFHYLWPVTPDGRN